MFTVARAYDTFLFNSDTIYVNNKMSSNLEYPAQEIASIFCNNTMRFKRATKLVWVSATVWLGVGRHNKD